MRSQCKIAILLTLAWLGIGNGTTGHPAVAADKQEPTKTINREFDKASKEALDLLQRESAKPRPDWVFVATAGAAKWDFRVIKLVGKNFAVPNPTVPAPGRLVLLPPLSDIVAPQGKRVIVDVTSISDIRSFAVPGLAIDTLAMPGRIQRIELDTTKPGFFPSDCADPCSAQARGMEFAIHVVDLEVFRHWYAAKDAATAQPMQR